MGNLLIYSAVANSCISRQALPRCRASRASRGRRLIHVRFGSRATR